MLQIEKKRFKNIFISGVLIAILVVCRYIIPALFEGNLSGGISVCCVIAIAVYCFLLYCCLNLKKDLVNIYSCLLAISFLFYYGQHLVVFLGKSNVLKTYYRSILDGRIPDSNRIDTSLFVLICMLVINIGVLLGCSNKSTLRQERGPDCSLYNSAVKRVSFIILCIVLVPTLYKYYGDVVMTFTYGYSVSHEMAIDTPLMKLSYFLSYFFLPSLYMLFICYSNSKKRYIIISIYLIYAFLYLLTGSRFRVFESLIAIILIVNSRIKKINGKDIVKLFVVGIAVVIIFSIVRDAREAVAQTSQLADIISMVWTKIKKEGLMTNALIETGSTFQLVDIVLYKTPGVVPFSYGYSVWGAVMIALPSFLRSNFDSSFVSTSALYSPQYLSEIDIGMGSSFLAEAYHNFGILSYIFILLFGIIVGRMLVGYDGKYRTQNNFSLYKYVYISSILCFAVRTDLVSYLRYYIYYVLAVQLLIKFYYDSVFKKQIH